jgi:hypothetical protein
VDQAIGIVGQAVLLLVGLAVIAALFVFILVCIRTVVRLTRDIRAERPSIMPETDSYVPEGFDRP